MEITSIQGKEYSTIHLNLKRLKIITRLTTVQNYLKMLCKRGEITEFEKKAMRSKFAQIAGAHGLPKTQKPFEHLPKFRPIIDTT